MLKLTYSNLEFHSFPGGGPLDPPLQGERREGKRKEGGRGRIAKGGEGREGTGEGRRGGIGGGGEGRGARHELPPRDKLRIHPLTLVYIATRQSNDPLRRTKAILCSSVLHDHSLTTAARLCFQCRSRLLLVAKAYLSRQNCLGAGA